MIAAVILAAGSSRRLGRPKQLIVLSGETLIRRTVATAIAARLHPVIVVANAVDRIVPLPAVAQVVLNYRHLEGVATSIHAGVEAAATAKASGVVIMACDQPALTAAHILKLIAEPANIAGSGYADKIGIPAYFPAAMFASLMQLEGDTGARNLLRNARCVAAEGLGLDIDTEEDLDRARTVFG